MKTENNTVWELNEGTKTYEEALNRILKLLNEFDDACKALLLRRKWIPVVVFAEEMNNLHESNVQAEVLNKEYYLGT